MKSSQLVAVLAMAMSSGLWASNIAVTGNWKTIDDETNKPKSIIQISQVGGVFEGKIVQLFRAPDEEKNPVCDKCKDGRKGQPLLGLTILKDLKKRDSDWGDGEILDPKNGKTYNVKMELIDDGEKLKVRGFIGFSLFGRTQTWVRVP